MISVRRVGIRGWGSIVADSCAALSVASLRGILECAGIQRRAIWREGIQSKLRNGMARVMKSEDSCERIRKKYIRCRNYQGDRKVTRVSGG